MSLPDVPYVTGRKKALARSLALEIAKHEETDWLSIKQDERERRLASALVVVDSWIANGVLAEFVYPWRD